MQLEGRKAIVTGAAHGIGEATARTYVKEGAKVVMLDIQDDLGEKVASEINAQNPGKAKFYHCDKSQLSEVKDVFARAIDDLAGVDILADVAGVSAMLTAPQDITEKQLDWILGVNLKGTIFTNQAVYQTMKDGGGGSIINFASSAAMVPIGVADYGAAKAGVVSWTRHVAKAWGPDNIRVNTVCPSAKTNDIVSQLEGEAKKRHEEHLQKILAAFAIPRLGSAELDIAPVMVFLAGEGSRYFTGQIMSVDGGYAMVR